MSRDVCKRCGGTGLEPRDPREEGRGWRETREDLGLGLREVARMTEVSPAYLSDLERGRRAWTGPAARRVALLLVARQNRRKMTREAFA